MKFLATVTFLFLSLNTFFCQGYYLKFQSGYGIGTSDQLLTSSTQTELETNVFSSHSETKTFSLGNGLQLNAAIGYYITSAVGVDVELQYSRGEGVSFTTDIINKQSNYKSEIEFSGKSFTINPSVFISTEFGMFKPYLKIGPMISFSSINRKDNTLYRTENVLLLSERTYNGSSAFGINSAIGTQINIFKNIGLNFELSSKNISYAPTKGTMDKYLVNGINQLEQIPVYVKENVFEDNYTYESKNVDLSKPSHSTRQNYSFSSIGLLIGVVISL